MAISVMTLSIVKKPVFFPGEILMLEPDFEREIHGLGRKPAKWFIEYEYFKHDELDKAMELANDVRK
jgi:hypothetical protein